MSVNGINSLTQTYSNDTVNTSAKTKSDAAALAAETDTTEKEAAVYESSTEEPTTEPAKKTYGKNQTIIDQLKSDAALRKQQLVDLVFNTLNKQGKTYDLATSIYDILRSEDFTVDPETAKQAQADIADDGYWGVEQTSDRLVSFAKALAGDDASKADLMIDALKKGFEEATEAWGDKLPELSQKTYETALSNLDDWKNSIQE